VKLPAFIIGAILFVGLAAGGSFVWGMNTGKAQAQSEQNAFFASRGFDPNNLPGGQGGTGGFGGQVPGGAGANGLRGARGTGGTIDKIEGNTITITDFQGQTVTVNIADSTTIVKTVIGDKSDLAVGKRITVQGERSGNSVSATSIQVSDLPDGVTVPGFFGGRTPPTPTPGK
jgi:Domain of unknown function (DUF5666)